MYSVRFRLMRTSVSFEYAPASICLATARLRRRSVGRDCHYGKLGNFLSGNGYDKLGNFLTINGFCKLGTFLAMGTVSGVTSP